MFIVRTGWVVNLIHYQAAAAAAVRCPNAHHRAGDGSGAMPGHPGSSFLAGEGYWERPCFIVGYLRCGWKRSQRDEGCTTGKHPNHVQDCATILVCPLYVNGKPKEPRQYGRPVGGKTLRLNNWRRRWWRWGHTRRIRLKRSVKQHFSTAKRCQPWDLPCGDISRLATNRLPILGDRSSFPVPWRTARSMAKKHNWHGTKGLFIDYSKWLTARCQMPSRSIMYIYFIYIYILKYIK